MKNKELAQQLEALRSIASNCRGKIGFAVAKNMRKIMGELTEYLHIRDQKILQYGKNGTITIEDDNFAKYQKEMAEYNNIETKVDILKITEKDLQDSDLTAEEMLGLYFMVEEDNHGIHKTNLG